MGIEDFKLQESQLKKYGNVKLNKDEYYCVLDFINQQQEIIESLKCCSNCGIPDFNEFGVVCKHSETCKLYNGYTDESTNNWQPIK